MATIKDMLKAIMTKYHLDQAGLASRYDVDKSQIPRWMTGQTSPRGKTMILIYEDYRKIS